MGRGGWGRVGGTPRLVDADSAKSDQIMPLRTLFFSMQVEEGGWRRVRNYREPRRLLCARVANPRSQPLSPENKKAVLHYTLSRTVTIAGDI